MMKSVKGRGPGRKAEPVGVAHTGSTVLMPGERTGDIYNLEKVQPHVLLVKLIRAWFFIIFILSSCQCEASPRGQQAAVLQRPKPSQIPETQSSSAWSAKPCGDG